MTSLADLYKSAKNNPDAAADWRPPDGFKGIVDVAKISKFRENAAFITWRVVQGEFKGKMFRQYHGYTEGMDFTVMRFMDLWGTLGFKDAEVLKAWTLNGDDFSRVMGQRVKGKTFIMVAEDTDNLDKKGRPYQDYTVEPRKGKAAAAPKPAPEPEPVDSPTDSGEQLSFDDAEPEAEEYSPIRDENYFASDNDTSDDEDELGDFGSFFDED